ncbi:MAG: hypothetical protein AAGI38_25015 [Bacteroidota bacterium]
MKKLEKEVKADAYTLASLSQEDGTETLEKAILRKLIQGAVTTDSFSATSYLYPVFEEELYDYRVIPSISVSEKSSNMIRHGTLNNFFPNDHSSIHEDTLDFLISVKESKIIIFYPANTGYRGNRNTRSSLKNGVTYFIIFDFSLKPAAFLINQPGNGRSLTHYQSGNPKKCAQVFGRGFPMGNKIKVKALMKLIGTSRNGELDWGGCPSHMITDAFGKG